MKNIPQHQPTTLIRWREIVEKWRYFCPNKNVHFC